MQANFFRYLCVLISGYFNHKKNVSWKNMPPTKLPFLVSLPT